MANLTNNLANLLLNADSYKSSHYLQYPQGTEYVSSYIEPRGGRANSPFSNVVFFGLQAFLKEYLCTPITMQDIDEAETLLAAHGVPFYREGWEYILTTHNGYMPVVIEALPEGTIARTGNAVVQVVNSDPKCYWLTSYLETALLRAVWYPSTVASLSNFCREVIKGYMELSCDNLDGLPFKLHDFGARGVSSLESAALGGLGHLVNFMGTDTLSAVVGASRWYNSTNITDMPAFSIPAAEHSTITSWGRENEVSAYRNMLDKFNTSPSSIVAVVSDSYDLWNAIENLWGNLLRDNIVNGQGRLVIRPDSGDPVEVILKALDLLASKFGYTMNTQGYKVLPDCVRLIQGDGINAESLQTLCAAIVGSGYSLDNVNFGMGGGLLQHITRDDMGWAMKASAISINGVWQDVYKDPITSNGSKRGRLAVITNEFGGYIAVREDELGERENAMQCVYRNGKLFVDEPLSVIRSRVW